MNKFRVIVISVVSVLVLSAIISTKTYGVQSSFDYETNYNAVFSESISNYNSTPLAVYANTRPTQGINGVKVTIAYTNGEVIASGTFPYQVSRSDIVGNVRTGRIAKISVLPVVDYQTVKGTVHYRY